MINEWVGVGRMVDVAELRYTGAGDAVATMRIAVDNGKRNGEKDTLFATVVVWKQQAEFISNYGAKGRLVAVVGRWTQRSYDKDGQMRTVYEVVASQVRLLDKPKDGGGGDDNSDPVPF